MAKKSAKQRKVAYRKPRVSHSAPAPAQSLQLVLRDPHALLPQQAPVGGLGTALTVTGEPTINVASLGTLNLKEKQIRALRRKAEDDEVEWKPAHREGPPEIPYLPHNGYRDRLDAAFGLGGWAMAPVGVPKEKDDVVYAPWALVIGGVPRFYAWGEQAYSPKNRQMTYGDAIEGTKSNAILRCGKELGIARELWSRRYIAELKRRVPVERRALGFDYAPRHDRPESRPPAAARTGWEQVKISDAQYGRLRGLMKTTNRTKIEVLAYIKAVYGYADGHSILRKDYDDICKAIEKPGPLPKKGQAPTPGAPVREADEVLPPITEADIPWRLER